MKIILASASPRRRELLEQIGLEFEIKVSDVEERVTTTDPGAMVEELSCRKAEAVLETLTDVTEDVLVIGADTVVAVGNDILGKPTDMADAVRMLECLSGRSHEVYTGVTLLYRSGVGRLAGEPAKAEAKAESEAEAEAQAEAKAEAKAESEAEAKAEAKAESKAEAEAQAEAKAEAKAESEAEAAHCAPLNAAEENGAHRVQRKTFYERTRVNFYSMTPEEISFYVSTGECLDKAGAYGIQGLCARYIESIEGDYSNVVGLPVGRLYQEAKEWMQRGVRLNKKAVLFDLDGTLSDSILSIKYCADMAVKPFGYGPFSIEQYKYFVGDGAANLIRRALAAGGDVELSHFQEAFARYREIFRDNCMYQVRPYEGIPELLAALKEQGLKLTVLSNKPHEETVNVIESLFGKGYFDVIRGQKDNVAIKPSPEGVFQILEQLELTAADVLYLGDTATDMKTGKSAGVFTVGALWGFREQKELEEGGADAIIGHPLELLKFTT